MLAVLIVVAAAPAAADPVLLPKFDDVAVIEGLSDPVALRFDAGGAVFVAEKAGRIKRFEPLPAPGPGQVVLDIHDEVMDFQDRGLLGLALHPQYPAVPFVYVLYTYDAPPGGIAPMWNDHCADPTRIGGGCVVSGRLARYTMVSTASGPQLVDPRVLIQDDWYQQYPSHSVGDLAFGPDGMLYVSAGDGASYQFVDTGEPNQINASFPSAGDPVHLGGALRSQDLLTSDDALGMNGAILRVDPETGAAAPGNPLPGARPIAFGLRNPYRIRFRPGSSELWIGDVGENTWEEIDRIADVGDAVIENFGWPCFEGDNPHPGYSGRDGCAQLVGGGLPPGTPGTPTEPFYAYRHGEAPGHELAVEPCRNGTSQAVAGVAFYPGGLYPAQYKGALFFADYAVGCIYAMRAGGDGIPDPGQIDVLERAADQPVALEAGPGGDIFYVSLAGAIRRITYAAELTAKATADTTTGDDPLTVRFDGSGSLDPGGGPLSYAWDLDGDGGFDDATGASPQHTFARGVYAVRLQVTDRNGKTAVSPPLTVTAGERPLATIAAPTDGAPWHAGQRIAFSGRGDDQQDGALAAAAMKWRIVLLHCPDGGCHQHPIESFEGVASGSFVAAPDGFPAYYDIELTVTDSSGFTGKTTVRIDGTGTPLELDTEPSGLPLLYTGVPQPTPFAITEVAGDMVTVEAPAAAERNGTAYAFTGWSDGGERSRVLAVPDRETRYVARYEPDRDRDGVVDSQDRCPDVAGEVCDDPVDVTGGCGCAGSRAPGGPLIALGLVVLGLGRAGRRRGVISKTM